MRQVFFLVASLFFTLVKFSEPVYAQEKSQAIDKTKYKIVFQVTSDDTLVHKMVVRQVNNTLQAAPNTQIEVVCFGPGISILVASKTKFEEKINELVKKDVKFMACENTMKERKIEKKDIIKSAGFVPVAILYIVKKQKQGWGYIKAGF
ncbi:MAG: DsrE family protein [Sphingobacteriales bacterium]|nr:MAG: DsrE family protein [Sphingobacteriales bacterium]